MPDTRFAGKIPVQDEDSLKELSLWKETSLANDTETSPSLNSAAWAETNWANDTPSDCRFRHGFILIKE